MVGAKAEKVPPKMSILEKVPKWPKCQFSKNGKWMENEGSR
jgi:hypothetical protein